MKNICLTVMLLFEFTGSLSAQSVWSNKNRLMPDKLRGLPVGIIMQHSPNPCYPVLIGDTYYWKHNTKATAVNQQLTVIECGSFIWYNESGWQANLLYTPAQFAEAFNCPKALLKPGKTFTYLKNWRFGKQTYGGDALWYIIAQDKSGKRYKGIALVETEDQPLINHKN